MQSQAHFFSPNYPRFAPLGGVMGELGGLGRGGDSSRKHSKYSPPWVCEKCARKHPDEMGCPSDSQDPLDPEEESLGHVHRSADEAMGCKKCKEGQRRRRRQVEADFLRGIRVSNLGHTHLSQAGAEYTCPIGPSPASYDPSLNCMRDARGNAVCSDGLRYPPDCPKTPPDRYFTPGITPDVVNGGILEGQVPPPRSAGSIGGSGSSTATVLAAGAGALGLGALLFFLFK